MKNRNEIMKLITLCQENLFLSGEDLELLSLVEEEDMFDACFKAILLGISVEDIREMQAHDLSAVQVRAKAREILIKRFRETDEMLVMLQTMNERIEKELSYSEKIREMYENRLQKAWDSEKEMLQRMIKSYEKEIARLEKDVVMLQKEVVNTPAVQQSEARRPDEVPMPSKKRRFFRQKEEELPNEKYKELMEYEEEKFRKNILMNPEYSMEQKKFLFACFNEGMKYKTIIRFAHPELPVDFMQALKERREKKGY